MFDHLMLGASLLWAVAIAFLVYAIGTSILTLSTWLLLPALGAMVVTTVFPVVLYIIK